MEWLIDQLQTTMDLIKGDSEEKMTALQVKSAELDLKLDAVQSQMKVVV